MSLQTLHEVQSIPKVTSLQVQTPDLEQEKKTIYNHPFYPLVSLLLEKCESATAQPDLPTPSSLESDITSFLQQHDNHKDFFTQDPDLDSMMMKAIQVLRIHLLEIEKVNELCNDFCTRYINCLKTKIQSDILLQDSPPASPTSERMESPMPGYHENYQFALSGCYGNGALDAMAVSSGLDSSGNLLHYSQHVYPGGSNAMDMGSYLCSSSSPHHPHHHHHHMSAAELAKQKRGVLPKRATQVMKQWLFQHLVHPYPTEDEKRQLAIQTNLTLLQVNNWFINARRRILQPMLDASNHIVGGSGDGPDGKNATGCLSNKKKKAATNRPTNNRFWPASLAAAAAVHLCNTTTTVTQTSTAASATPSPSTTTSTPPSSSITEKEAITPTPRAPQSRGLHSVSSCSPTSTCCAPQGEQHPSYRLPEASVSSSYCHTEGMNALQIQPDSTHHQMIPRPYAYSAYPMESSYIPHQQSSLFNYPAGPPLHHSLSTPAGAQFASSLSPVPAHSSHNPYTNHHTHSMYSAHDGLLFSDWSVPSNNNNTQHHLHNPASLMMMESSCYTRPPYHVTKASPQY